MPSYCKVVLVGNLGRDAEMRYTPQGTPVLSASIAVEDFGKKDDRGKPTTEWYRIKVWGKQAETLKAYLTKGKTILVDGRLSIQTWTDRDGKSRYTPEVSADKVVLLGGGQREGQTSGGRQASPDIDIDTPDDVTAEDIPF